MDEKDLAIQDLKKHLVMYEAAYKLSEEKLAAAIEDVPHVGKYCKRLDQYGCCTFDNRFCHRQVNTICPDWVWRGESE